MNVKYNIAVNTVNAALKIYAHCLPKHVKHKFPEFVKGRIALIRRIAAEMEADKSNAPVVWFHASSLGEFAIARPLISRLKAMGEVRVVLTFFSPSGYRALREKHPDVDHLFYLPLDTRSNAKGFLEAVKPDAAVFMVSEYWPNILQELKFRSVPTYLVSAIIRNNSAFFRRYGKIFRKALLTYRHFFVLDKNSMLNLQSLGCENVTISGDPLFDNAALVARTPWHDPVLDRFTASADPVLIGGSISDSHDIALISRAIKDNPAYKSIIVPHDITGKSLKAIRSALPAGTAFYSELSAHSDLSAVRHIIVDCVGKLAFIYRYATVAYVGGGFTPLLHSVIEATVYGLPVSFGPRIERKVTPQQLIDRGIGHMVTSPEQLSAWVASLTPEKLTDIKRRATEYVDSNLGATTDIVKTIASVLWPKK